MSNRRNLGVLFPALGIVAGLHFAAGVELRAARTGPRTTGPQPLVIRVQPEMAVMGTPFTLTLAGLDANEEVTVKAASVDKRGGLFRSSAVFAASPQGTVDVASQAPLSGDYAGADIFGLLWSMQTQAAPDKRPPSYAQDEVDGWTVDFEARSASGKSASVRLRRVYQMSGQGLVRIPLDEDGMRGFLYCPDKGDPFPGVLILGGSNGGLYEWLAQAFASQGFAALTLAYFSYPGLPDELVEIPLEYFSKAMAWMKARPQIKSGSLGLAGGSKGGELALLLASRFSDFQAVVAWTPSAHVWEGLSQKYFSPDYVPRSSWSFEGKPLPFVSFNSRPEDKALELKGELNSYVALHQRALAEADPAVLEKAAIPIENIKAPILLISGTQDQTWPADDFCRAIMSRLESGGFAYEHRHISHRGAGHQSFLPYLITAHTAPISGGADKANAAAGFVSWRETIAFLNKHLRR